MAAPADAGALRRLAQLDSAAPLSGRVLLAELDGAPLAALSLETGAATADPFQPSADAVRLLMLRRWQLMRERRDGGPTRLLLRRLTADATR
jgi:hypothetical protein